MANQKTSHYIFCPWCICTLQGLWKVGLLSWHFYIEIEGIYDCLSSSLCLFCSIFEEKFELVIHYGHFSSYFEMCHVDPNAHGQWAGPSLHMGIYPKRT